MLSLYGNVKNYVKESIADVKFPSLTSVANDSYLAITMHVIDAKWKMKRKTLAIRNLTENHTGAYIAQELQSCITEYNISQPVCTTDNGAKHEVSCTFKWMG